MLANFQTNYAAFKLVIEEVMLNRIWICVSQPLVRFVEIHALQAKLVSKNLEPPMNLWFQLQLKSETVACKQF